MRGPSKRAWEAAFFNPRALWRIYGDSPSVQARARPIDKHATAALRLFERKTIFDPA